MKRLLILALALATLFAVAPARSTFAQQTSGPSNAVKLSPDEINRIIRAFSAKESQFRQALNSYGFKRDAVLQTIGLGGQISGEYHRVSYFTFDDKGARYEKINFFPLPTIQLQITQEDLDDLGGIQPFALEAEKINQYNFNYAGKEKIDELDLYVFDVAPKVMPDPNKTKTRYFQGRIWVDDHDLQIVKVRGKAVPEGKQRFPTFETYREQVDEGYWFPTYTYADDNLVFSTGEVVHFRMRVTYSDYKRGRADVKITEISGDDEPTPTPSPTPSPTPNKKP